MALFQANRLDYQTIPVFHARVHPLEGGVRNERMPTSWFEARLAPEAVLLGAVLAFLACCAAGHRAATCDASENFTRFHPLIAPESLHYPTIRQLRQLARAKLDPAKVAVIVGGSSILQGTGQPAGDVWTTHLQQLLGSDYCVLNLGLRCAAMNEFGAVVAEVVRDEFPRLLFVTDLSPGKLPEADGLLQRFLFWDAQVRGLLIDDATREKALQTSLQRACDDEARLGRKEALDRHLMSAEAQRELRAAMRIDTLLAFRDLWTSLAYTSFSTLWTPRTRANFLAARRTYGDPEPGPRPLERRISLGRDKELEVTRELLASAVDVSPGLEHATPWKELRRAIDTSFPGAVRQRTLVAVMRLSPYRLVDLEPDERQAYERVIGNAVAVLRSTQVHAMQIGAGYEFEDYADGRHLAPSGGVRLAHEVAARLADMAHELGYLANQ